MEYIATLASGLRNNSRIMLKASGINVDINTLLMARIVDNTALNLYAKTKDARTGRNRPKSMTELLLKKEDESTKPVEFDTGEDFLKEWNRITGNGKR